MKTEHWNKEECNYELRSLSRIPLTITSWLKSSKSGDVYILSTESDKENFNSTNKLKSSMK